jgi:hypothetical protein
LGGGAVLVKTSVCRSRWIHLRPTHAGPGLPANHLPVRIARHWCRPASGILVSGRKHARLLEPQRLRRIRQQRSPGRLQCVADVFAVTRAADSAIFAAVDYHQVTAQLSRADMRTPHVAGTAALPSSQVRLRGPPPASAAAPSYPVKALPPK